MFMKFLETANFDWIELLNFYERPFRAKLNPSKIWKDLDRYRNDARGLSNYFKKWRTKLVFKPCPKKSWAPHIGVGGEYDPDTRQCILDIYALDFNNHKFTDLSWRRFKYKLMQTHMHEMIHFMQFDCREDRWSRYVLRYKKADTRRQTMERHYLSCFDEVQAYAHCVYLDYKMKRPNMEIEDLLARCINSKRDSDTMHYILKTFNYDMANNNAPRKLIDQIVKWDRKYKRVTK